MNSATLHRCEVGNQPFDSYFINISKKEIQSVDQHLSVSCLAHCINTMVLFYLRKDKSQLELDIETATLVLYILPTTAYHSFLANMSY